MIPGLENVSRDLTRKLVYGSLDYNFQGNAPSFLDRRPLGKLRVVQVSVKVLGLKSNNSDPIFQPLLKLKSRNRPY